MLLIGIYEENERKRKKIIDYVFIYVFSIIKYMIEEI